MGCSNSKDVQPETARESSAVVAMQQEAKSRLEWKMCQVIAQQLFSAATSMCLRFSFFLGEGNTRARFRYFGMHADTDPARCVCALQGAPQRGSEFKSQSVGKFAKWRHPRGPGSIENIKHKL